jgi:hypothetical protein
MQFWTGPGESKQEHASPIEVTWYIAINGTVKTHEWDAFVPSNSYAKRSKPLEIDCGT